MWLTWLVSLLSGSNGYARRVQVRPNLVSLALAARL